MNASRIYNVTNEIITDFDDFATLDKLEALYDAINATSSPPDPDGQSEINDAQADLLDSIESFHSNRFGPVKAKLAQDLGLADLTGPRFIDLITDTLNPQNISDLDIAGALEQLHTETKAKIGSLRSLNHSLDTLNIKPAKLTDHAEVAISLPEELTHNSSESFRQHLRKTELVIGSLQEAIEGKKDPVKIQDLGDGCLEVVLACTPVVASCIADCITKLLDLYERVLRIRKLKKELDEMAVPPEATEPLGMHEKDYVSNGIKEIKINITNNFYGDDQNRQNELENALDRSIDVLKEFIDKGVLIDVESPPPDEEEDNEANSNDGDDGGSGSEAKSALLQETMRKSIEARKKYRNLERADTDILSLPSREDNPEQIEEDGSASLG